MVRRQNLRNEETPTIKTLIILALFIASLQAFSLDIAGQGVTANYVYVLIPFVFWLVGVKRRLVRREQVVQIILIYSLIYFIGFPGDIFEFNNNIGTPIRRLASFLVFLFPLFLSLVEFKPSDISIFKTAVIIVSVYYSLNSILAFGSLSGVGVFELKGLLGSQRYGFILCLGFFISLFNDKLIIKKWILPQRVFICSIILIGAIFTFSRATIVSLIGGLVFFLVLVLFKKNRRINGKLALQATNRKFKPFYLITSLVLVASVFIAFQSYYDVKFLEFYQTRFIDPLLDGTLMESTLGNDPESSEGYRYYTLIRILDYLAAHPLFGSNYQGLYLLYDEFEGSASTHNQYSDIFLRTGLLGGLLWLFLLYRVFRFCSHDRGLQVGLVSILIYGFFHETFKLSQGSFVFGMLLSFSYMSAYITNPRKLLATPLLKGANTFPLL